MFIKKESFFLSLGIILRSRQKPGEKEKDS